MKKPMLMADVYQVCGPLADSRNAGPKAVRDVTAILRAAGVHDFHVVCPEVTGVIGGALSFIVWFARCCLYRLRLPKHGVLFIQYPGYRFGGRAFGLFLNARLKARKDIKVVALVHDINAVRVRYRSAEGGIEPLLRVLLNLSDAVIVHNEKMAAWLAQRGFDHSRLIPLEVFDYLVKGRGSVRRRNIADSGLPRIAVAGNLAPDKSGYLSRIDEIPGVSWVLYGLGADKLRKMERVDYMGCFDPSDLPNEINADFGLVWDGPTIDTCSSESGEYLRINNPHKLSLYLVAGIPVVIWSHAAEADFVRREGVGIVVDSLLQIQDRLPRIGDTAYEEMRRNVDRIANRMRRGDYMLKAMSTALAVVQGRHEGP